MAHRDQLNAYDAIQAMLAANPPSLAFAGGTAAEYQAWRAQFARAYAEMLGPWPRAVPPETEVAEEVDAGSHTRLRLYFDSAPGVTVPAYLLVPKGIAPGERRPGILAAHGHGDGIWNDGKDDLVGLGLDDARARRVHPAPEPRLRPTGGGARLRRHRAGVAALW